MTTPRDHALRVAVLSALLDAVKAEHTAARKAAEAEFATVRAEGQKQQAVMLPDGTDIGLISIKAGTPSVAVKEADLEAWVREHLPDGIEEYARPEALTDAEVLDMLKACFPHAVGQRIRQQARDVLLKEMAESGGKLTDKATGEVTQLGEVEQHKPTGAFSYRAAKGAQDRIVSEWRAGRLTEVAFGPLALPGADDVRVPPTEAEVAAMREALYMDEYGFLGPEAAAAHACLVQGGYSTPPIEAYRMIRDGGVGAERARAWLTENGLDLDDPREGRDTPWPLPPAGDAA